MSNEPIPQQENIKLPGTKLRKACEKCEREITVANYKRHYDACIGTQKKEHLPLDKVKSIPSICSNCNREFSNVFRMSAHKGHCTGANNTSHLDGKREWNKGKFLLNKEQIFSNHLSNSKRYNQTVKKYFLQFSKQKYQCLICGISEWCNQKLVLELDHINGNNCDNRLENLRLLCPNCHSQTSNFRGRNKQKSEP